MKFLKRNNKNKSQVKSEPKKNKDEKGFMTDETKRDIGVQTLRWAMLSPNFIPDGFRYGKRVGGAGVKFVSSVDKGARTASAPFYNLYRIIRKGERPGRDGEYIDEDSPTIAGQFLRGELTDQQLLNMGVAMIKNNHLMCMLFVVSAVAFLSLLTTSVGWQTLFGMGALMMCILSFVLKYWSGYMKILVNKNYSPAGFMLHFAKNKQFSMMIPIITDPMRLEKRVRFLSSKKKERDERQKNNKKGEV